MPIFRFFVLVLVAVAAAGCARQQQAYVLDPATGRPVPVMWRQPTAPAQYAQIDRQPKPEAVASNERGLFDWRQRAAQPQYAQQTYAQQTYAPQAYVQPATQQTYMQPPAPQANARHQRPLGYAPPPTPQPYVAPYYAPQYARARVPAPSITAPDSFASASLY
ncbi:MAG: hypothetical protein ACREB8_12705 [Pseudolabrys sp.]